jgi:HSP20 family molecular chaperone IbpA
MNLFEFATKVCLAPRPELALAAKSDGDFVELTIPMPGVKKEDVSVEVDGQDLVVRGQSRHPGFDVTRSFSMNFDVDVPRSSAELQDGVLTLKLARATKAARIEVH